MSKLLKHKKVMPAARAAVAAQLRRLDAWSERAGTEAEAIKINSRAEELEAIGKLLDYAEQLESTAIAIGEDAYREGFNFAKSIFDTEDHLQPIVSMITGDHLVDGKWCHTPPPYVLTPNPAYTA